MPSAKPTRTLSLAWVYAAAWQCTVSALVFFLTAVVKLPILLYFPLSRRWSLTANPDELSMDFYGRSLLALGAGLLALLLTLAYFAVRARVGAPAVSLSEEGVEASEVPASRLGLLTGYAVTALFLAVLLYAYMLYGRAPVPEPLPPGFPSIQKLPGPPSTKPLPP